MSNSLRSPRKYSSSSRNGPPQNLGHGRQQALFRDNAAIGLQLSGFWMGLSLNNSRIGLPGLACGGLRYLPTVLELCFKQSTQPLLHPSRMQFLSPVAEAEPVASRSEEHFPARRLVPDSPYCSGLDEEPVGHLGASVVLDHYLCLTGHAVAEGHLLRREVIVPDDGADYGGVQGAEGVVHAGAGGLRGVTLMPVGALEEVAGFQHFPAVPLLEGQAALAYHLSGGLEHHCPETVAPLPVSGELPLQPFVHFLIGERAVVGVHDFAVLQDAAQCRPVGRSHLTQKQPLCFNDNHISDGLVWQIYAEAESRTNLFTMPMRNSICGRQAKYSQFRFSRQAVRYVRAEQKRVDMLAE